MKRETTEQLREKIRSGNVLLATRMEELQKLNAKLRERDKEEERFTSTSVRLQLENRQLKCQLDVLLASLADAQRRLMVLRHKTRPCGCGAGVNEDTDESGMTLTDEAAELL